MEESRTETITRATEAVRARTTILTTAAVSFAIGFALMVLALTAALDRR